MNKAHSLSGAPHLLLEKYRAEIARCVKCGSCSAVCPSFLQARAESLSARGRMALIKAVLDGRLIVSGIFKDRLATCTTCLACEAACASGVHVTDIIQAAKEQVVEEAGMGLVKNIIAGVLKSDAALRATAWLAPVALHYTRESFGDRRALQRIPLFSRPFLDQVSKTSASSRVPKRRAGRKRVAFFVGCATNYFQQDIGRSVLRLLERLGFDVVVPHSQKCCGRPLLSLGDRKGAEELAAHNSGLFAGLEADALVTACASCGLTFKREYPKLLPPGAKRPVLLDIHEFLIHELADVKFVSVKKTVTVHDPCHLGRGQGLSQVVRGLLRRVPGLALAEMKNADRCCGFGGVMRVTHRALSGGIAEEKAKSIIATNAPMVATGCPGCRMQITDALRRTGSDVKVLHPVQILEEALGNSE
jgi:glycolate oxidase iron-sulfur subunit